MAAYHAGALAAGFRQANAAGIAFENHRGVIDTFSEPGKPNDTGRTEVLGAYLLFFSLLCSAFGPPLGEGGGVPRSIACLRNPVKFL